MKRAFITGLALLALSGCAVAPAPYAQSYSYYEAPVDYYPYGYYYDTYPAYATYRGTYSSGYWRDGGGRDYDHRRRGHR